MAVSATPGTLVRFCLDRPPSPGFQSWLLPARLTVPSGPTDGSSWSTSGSPKPFSSRHSTASDRRRTHCTSLASAAGACLTCPKTRSLPLTPPRPDVLCLRLSLPDRPLRPRAPSRDLRGPPSSLHHRPPSRSRPRARVRRLGRPCRPTPQSDSCPSTYRSGRAVPFTSLPPHSRRRSPSSCGSLAFVSAPSRAIGAFSHATRPTTRWESSTSPSSPTFTTPSLTFPGRIQPNPHLPTWDQLGRGGPAVRERPPSRLPPPFLCDSATLGPARREIRTSDDLGGPSKSR